MAGVFPKEYPAAKYRNEVRMGNVTRITEIAARKGLFRLAGKIFRTKDLPSDDPVRIYAPNN